MRNWTRLLLASVVVLVVSSCPAWGDIQNGDFSDGLTGWNTDVWPENTPSQALVEVVSGQLHVRVANSYVYNSTYGFWEPQPQGAGISNVWVTQNVIPNGGAPLGTTGLQFKANVQISDIPAGTTFTYVRVGVNYETDTGERTATWITPFSTNGLETITVNLPDLIEDPNTLDLYLEAISFLDGPWDPSMPTTWDVLVDGTFDDLQFIGGGLAGVLIDIKPGDSTNSINLGSNGGVPVAILGSETFDVLQVDPLSVTLADAGVRIRGKGKSIFSTEDVNGDGLLDMILNIDTQALVLAPDATEAVLKGMTYDGASFQGSDYVTIVGQGATGETAPAPTPEPSSVMLLILSGMSVLRRRRSHGN